MISSNRGTKKEAGKVKTIAASCLSNPPNTLSSFHSFSCYWPRISMGCSRIWRYVIIGRLIKQALPLGKFCHTSAVPHTFNLPFITKESCRAKLYLGEDLWWFEGSRLKPQLEKVLVFATNHHHAVFLSTLLKCLSIAQRELVTLGIITILIPNYLI